LHGGIRKLSDRVILVKAKKSLNLIHSCVFLHLNHILIHVLDILSIQEDESLLDVEPESNDIFDVTDSHIDYLIKA
jgi:hypothetical protein